MQAIPTYIDNVQQEVHGLFDQALTVLESNNADRMRSFAAKLQDISQTLGEVQQLMGNSMRERGIVPINGNANGAPVTMERIRETFYNAIPDAMRYGFDNKLFTPQQVDEGLFIQSALPALTLILVMEASKDVKDGIMLRDRVTVVTKQNCPDDLKTQLKHLLRVKEDICELLPPAAMHLKIACVNDPDKKLPVNTPNYEEITLLAAGINRVAGQIMQREKYKELMNEVLRVGLVAAQQK